MCAPTAGRFAHPKPVDAHHTVMPADRAVGLDHEPTFSQRSAARDEWGNVEVHTPETVSERALVDVGEWEAPISRPFSSSKEPERRKTARADRF